MDTTQVYFASGTCPLPEVTEKCQELLAAFYEANPAAEVLTANSHTSTMPSMEMGVSGGLLVSITLTYNTLTRYWAECVAIAQQQGNQATPQQIWDSSTRLSLEQVIMDRERAAMPAQAASEGVAALGGAAVAIGS